MFRVRGRGCKQIAKIFLARCDLSFTVRSLISRPLAEALTII